MESVYCAVRTDSLRKADYVSSLKGQSDCLPSCEPQILVRNKSFYVTSKPERRVMKIVLQCSPHSVFLGQLFMRLLLLILSALYNDRGQCCCCDKRATDLLHNSGFVVVMI